MTKAFQAVKSFLQSLDIALVLICLCCSGISIICMYSFYVTGARDNRALIVQVVALGLGLIAAFVLSAMDYEVMAKLWKLHAPIALFLVLLTFFIGEEVAGADDKAWLNLFGITTIQPSELLKLSFILTFSLHLSKTGENINRLRPFLLLCLHGAVPILMIMLQGDFGSALVFGVIFIGMMFVAGLSLRWILAGITACAMMAPLIWFFILPSYLKQRFFVALHPEIDPLDKGLQQYNGRLSLGSGHLFGRGIGSEDLYNGVPEARNDFIYSYIGQTMGFVGCMITLLLITLLCVKILMTARMSYDSMGCYICTGVFAMLLFQSTVNIGMVLCIVPVIGITLPLFSAGGTSVTVTYMAIGLVLSVYRKNKKDLMFN